MKRHARCGFTVVEMMVVIGIFIVLIGLVIPVTSTVRLNAMRTKCLSNMRGLQLAHLAYATDNRGRFVNVGVMPHDGLTDEQVEEAELPIWYFALQAYYDKPLVLKSPIDRSKHWPQSMDGQGVPLSNGTGFRRTSYGMNDYLMPHNPAYTDDDDPENIFDRLSKVRNPTNTVNFAIIAFEGDYAGSDHMHPEQWLEMPFLPVEQRAADFLQTNAYDGAARTFDARSGYSFLDGHVATHRFADLVHPEQPDEMNKFHPNAAVAYTAQQAINQ